MRSSWVPLLVVLTSCRAACGLDELEGVGGGGGVGAAGGAGTTDATTTSVGGAGGGTSTGGAGGAGGGDLLCADQFPEVTPPPDPEPTDCLVVEPGCIESGTGGAGGGSPCSGSWGIEGGRFRITPGPLSGFWNGWSSVYLHTTAVVPGSQPFIARTRVQTRRSGGSEAWPEQPFQLAGLVVSATTDAATANDWFKAEYGTLDEATTFGMRTVRRMGGNALTDPLTDGRIQDSEDTSPHPTPPWVDVAVCRVEGGELHGFYRPEGAASWTAVAPSDNVAFTAEAYVGMVAASGSNAADLVALFEFFELVAVQSLPNVAACQAWLVNHPASP